MKEQMKRYLMLVAVILVCEALAGTYEGGNGDPNDPFRIKTAGQFDAIRCHEEDWDKHFLLTENINIKGYDGCDVLNIIGHGANPFRGVFDGDGHTISGFEYSDSGGPIGLFGVVEGGEIRNLGLIEPNLISPSQGMAGLLVGALAENGQISNCYIIGGNLLGEGFAGGLVGWLRDGTIVSCRAEDTKVNGLFHVGGLVGVSGTYSVGQSAGNLIIDSYADCNVIGDSQIGGLVGHLGFGETVRRCYATGSVQGGLECGGLIGWSWEGVVEDCYATALVGGTESVAGLVGKNQLHSNLALIVNCYSAGAVEAAQPPVGGLIAENSGSVVNCFWNVETSGTTDGVGDIDPDPNEVLGLDSVTMMTPSTFTDAGWDFDSVWRICNGLNYPRLLWEPKPVGDLSCPEGVEMSDLNVFVNQWLFAEITMDLASDGVVDLMDWTILAEGWQETYFQDDLIAFANQWLLRGATYCSADIAPLPDGDGKVNLLDFAVFVEYWLMGAQE